MAQDIRCTIHNSDIPCAKCVASNTPDSKQEALELAQAIADMEEGRDSHAQWAAHLRDTSREDCQGCAPRGAHTGDVEHHDAWIAKYDRVIKLLRSRASVAAVEGDAVRDLITTWRARADAMEPEVNRTWDDDGALKMRTIRELADELAAASSPAPAEPPPSDAHRCPHCSRRMQSDFDEDVGMWYECANCDYREAVSSRPAEPLQPTGEQEHWSSGGCSLFRNGAWVTSTATPEVAVFLARRLNNSATPTTPSDAAMRAAEEIHALCDKLAPDIPNDSTSYAPTVEQIAAIITRHLVTPTADVCAGHTTDCGIWAWPGAPCNCAATATSPETPVGGEAQHHKHCSIWTVTTSGEKRPCDCVCKCGHSMFEHIRPGEHYWYEDCAVDDCPCMKFTAAPIVATADNEGEENATD